MHAPRHRFRREEAMARSHQRGTVRLEHHSWIGYMNIKVLWSPFDPLWTPEQVARRLNVSPDWVRDHSSRKEPRLPVIRLGGGPGRAELLRYRPSQIEKFIEEMERLSTRNSRRI